VPSGTDNTRKRQGRLWVQLLVGVGLFVLSWRYDSARRRKRGEPDRVTRWRARVLHDPDASRGLVRLAVTAGALELVWWPEPLGSS
jgi:hypothetical protein